MSNTPQIRFAGFTDAWEQRELSDLIEENQKPVPKPDGEYVRLGIRSHAKGTFHEVVAEGEGLDVDTMYVVEANNLIVNITFAWEEAWAITSEKDAEKLVSHRFPQYRFHQGQYPMFYQYRFRNGRMKYNLELASPGGAGRNRVLNKTEFMKIPVTIPTSYEEEKKIGDLFANLDNLITLHQRKCDALQKFKKSMLQKKFPQNGESVPEIRFAGFTDAWEQRKFSDFTFPAGERNKDDLDLEPFAITNNQGFIAQSEAHDDFGYMKDVDRKMYIVVKPNSFAYNPARINVGSLGYYEGAENVIVSSLYEVFQTAEYVDDKFLKHWFKTKAFQDWIERLQEGSVRLYFYYDKLCECIMSMPSVEEQRKIGAYLDKIDNLITLHQRKLETLQKMKKSLLQKMFV